MNYGEIKDLAKAAATAYVIGAHIQDPKVAVDKFMEAYNYSLKNSLDALQDINNSKSSEDIRKEMENSIFDMDFGKHF